MGWKMFFKFPENLSRQCIGSDHFLVKYRKNQTVYFFPFTHTASTFTAGPIFHLSASFLQFSHQFFIILTRFLFFLPSSSLDENVFHSVLNSITFHGRSRKEFFEISTHSIYTKTWTNCCRKRSYSKNFTAARHSNLSWWIIRYYIWPLTFLSLRVGDFLYIVLSFSSDILMILDMNSSLTNEL